MRTIGKLTLAFGLVAALSLAAAPAKAQFRMGGMGSGMGGLMALTTETGQKELGLTEDQVEKVRAVSENVGATIREKFQGFQDLTPEERQAKAREVSKEITAEIEKELKGILKEDQFKRFQQISLQASGVNAFEQEEIAKKLELTDDQKSKIQGVLEGVQEEMRAARQSGGGPGAFGKMQEIRQKAKEKAVALLTDKQKTLWAETTGKEFKFEMGPPPGGGGGPRRRPNN